MRSPLPGARRPMILLTNDDGIQAPGLLALASSLRGCGEVAVVAPDRNWSASGHAKTMHRPLRAWQTKLTDGHVAIATDGSPADCVAMALLGLLDHTPDLVVSGINPGANVATDMTYSGTVTAAMEGVIGGIPAIAASLDSYQEADYGVAARFVAHLALRVLESDPTEPLLLNVNVPARPAEEIKGVQVTRLGRRVYRDALIKRSDPRGRYYYWIGGEPPTGVSEEGTDIGALSEGYISVTPLRLDLTDHARLSSLREWELGLPPP